MIGLVRNEWKKVFLPVLLTTVLLAIAMSVLSCTIYQNYVLHYDLEAWEVGTELFSLLYPLFVVVPLCWNLYYERKNNFLLYVMPRVKIKKYLTAKWIAYALGTLCIIVIPYILSAVFAIYVKPPVVPFVEFRSYNSRRFPLTFLSFRGLVICLGSFPSDIPLCVAHKPFCNKLLS